MKEKSPRNNKKSKTFNFTLKQKIYLSQIVPWSIVVVIVVDIDKSCIVIRKQRS